MKRFYFIFIILFLFTLSHLSSIKQSINILNLEIPDYKQIYAMIAISPFGIRFFGEKLSTGFALIFPDIDFVKKF